MILFWGHEAWSQNAAQRSPAEGDSPKLLLVVKLPLRFAG
jgi:hypothetical protein